MVLTSYPFFAVLHFTMSATIAAPELLKLLKARDPATLERIVREHTEVLLRAALGLGFDRESANELVQRVWFTFVEIVERFEGRSQVRTFLFGILYRKASEFRRQNSRPDSPDPIDGFIEDRFNASDGHWKREPVDPERFAVAAQTLELIKGCLEVLPTAQRMAFWMKEVEEETTEQICNVLEITATNLGVVLFRARNKLRECLESKV